MIMIDLNGLKQANDDCGHDPGNSLARARAASEGGAADAFGRAMSELRSSFGSPLASASSPGLVRLDTPPWTGGAYSHALPMHTDARLKLAPPFEDRIFFGGDATHPAGFFTAHGALESATRKASEVLRL
jgi:monoamine oxidase